MEDKERLIQIKGCDRDITMKIECGLDLAPEKNKKKTKKQQQKN